MSLPWQPGSVVVVFVWHYSIALPQKPGVGRKYLLYISYTSWVIADFVSNFVAMAMGVGRGKICLASFNSPTLKTPCYTQRSRRYLLHRPSYSRLCPKFRCHGNGVGRSRICLASFNSPTLKTPAIGKDLRDISYIGRIKADFVQKFVAMAMGVGRSRICMVSFNSLTPKTPC